MAIGVEPDICGRSKLAQALFEPGELPTSCCRLCGPESSSARETAGKSNDALRSAKATGCCWDATDCADSGRSCGHPTCSADCAATVL